MNQGCAKCAKDPNTHSFRKVSEKNGISIYYTHPSKATEYDDTEGILEHIDGALSQLGNKRWVCVIDGTDFDVKHLVQVKTGRGIVELITTKYGANLKQIYIINPSWHIKGLVKCLSAFFDEKTIERIVIMDDRHRSILEFM
jgi:hypothetical protein